MKSSEKYKLKCINEDFQVTEVSLMPKFVLKNHTNLLISGFKNQDLQHLMH